MKMFQMISRILGTVCLAFLPCAFGQPAPAQSAPAPSGPSAGYLLGPDDQILIRVLDGFDGSDKPVLIGTNGSITLPLIGRVVAAGLTVQELEARLTVLLKTYIQDPQVSVTVVEFRSQPVSVLGAVAAPGTFQVRGRKTLYEVLSMAGGPRDTAGSSVSIIRRREYGPIPLPDAVPDPTGRFFTAEIQVQEILAGKNPAADIEIRPYDVISVSQGNARQIYVVGDVQHAGAFALGPQKNISVLAAVALAGGLGRTANPQKAKIFRPVEDEPRHQEISVNIKLILAGKAEDIRLRPEDVLVVPTSSRKTFTTYVVPATIASAVAAAIYAGTHY
jgi:polysaccharide export outer membrane protein